jgi:hypothetical protein
MKTLENIAPHCVKAKSVLRLQKSFGLIVVVVYGGLGAEKMSGNFAAAGCSG